MQNRDGKIIHQGPRFELFRKMAKKVASFISTKNGAGLQRPYWLEALDDQHRPSSYLHGEFARWQSSDTRQGFFASLTDTSVGTGISYRSWQTKRLNTINYFGEEARYVESKYRLDTTRLKGKCRNSVGCAAYVMMEDGRLFLGEFIKNMQQHSTFSEGKRVLSAGMMRIEKGKIVFMDNNSGHYRPALEHLTKAGEKLKGYPCAENLVVTQVKIPLRIHRLLNSKRPVLRILGKFFELLETRSEVALSKTLPPKNVVSFSTADAVQYLVPTDVQRAREILQMVIRRPRNVSNLIDGKAILAQQRESLLSESQSELDAVEVRSQSFGSRV